LVVNYQNWGDPFVVILALPATFCGIVTIASLLTRPPIFPACTGGLFLFRFRPRDYLVDVGGV